ncbi:hypothetical protein FOYG_11348 [Fusarium oxysporum NRRL 32931]|uniref:Uncharacterized protein n=1 Tax=Fusarium oxysporum NRRL 32931 TaxID=660029 RepID=W9I256_FUSOX|nr:hypothetical protein FOYG_11348 [Fusarium oxysporum NRRL 32931]
MASVNQRKTLDGERPPVGELVQPPREVSHQPPGQRHLGPPRGMDSATIQEPTCDGVDMIFDGRGKAQLHLKIRQEDPLEQSLSNG